MQSSLPSRSAGSIIGRHCYRRQLILRVRDKDGVNNFGVHQKLIYYVEEGN